MEDTKDVNLNWSQYLYFTKEEIKNAELNIICINTL